MCLRVTLSRLHLSLLTLRPGFPIPKISAATSNSAHPTPHSLLEQQTCTPTSGSDTIRHPVDTQGEILCFPSYRGHGTEVTPAPAGRREGMHVCTHTHAHAHTNLLMPAAPQEKPDRSRDSTSSPGDLRRTRPQQPLPSPAAAWSSGGTTALVSHCPGCESPCHSLNASQLPVTLGLSPPSVKWAQCPLFCRAPFRGRCGAGD